MIAHAAGWIVFATTVSLTSVFGIAAVVHGVFWHYGTALKLSVVSYIGIVLAYLEVKLLLQ